MTTNIETRITDGYYTNNTVTPTKPTKTCLCCNNRMSIKLPKFCPDCGTPFIEAYEKRLKLYKIKQQEFNDKSNELNHQFKLDLLTSYNYDHDNEKAMILVEKCWDTERTNGLRSVVEMFDDFEEVL